MHDKKLAIFFAMATALFAAPAEAEIYDISLKGVRGDATFSIDTATAIPSASGFQVFFDNVSGVYNGNSQTADVSFGANVIASDFQITGTTLGFFGFEQFAGPILIEGPLQQPTLTVGTFDLSSILSGPATITISAVPETSTWVMLLMGFAAVGGIAYRKRQTGTAVLAV
jgi:hypothetical protein